LLPVDDWQMLPCSFSKPDVHAWRSEIEQKQSAMRDNAALPPNYTKPGLFIQIG